MILTNKALTDFIKFSSNGDGYIYVNKKTSTGIHYSNLSEDILNLFIIQWLDSVGIYISILREDIEDEHQISHGWKSYIQNGNKIIRLRTLPYKEKITEYAIKKANDIYNARFEN